MDDLLNIATKTMEKFNPATDSVDNFEEVADGKYQCLLEKVTNKTSAKTGNTWISFDFSIIGGENDGRHIFVNYFFTDKTIERSIKSIIKLAYEFGYDLPTDAFADFETLATSLDAMSGNQAMVDKKTTDSGFVTYKVDPNVLS